jgi:predicted transglutaminase-like cysteine proteinase
MTSPVRQAEAVTSGNPERFGCKDYVLVKRRKLIEAGVPRESLLIAIVWTAQEQGHAVLIAHTDRGDFVLDNLMPNVQST